MNYCECGSLMIKDSCSNKKCTHHDKNIKIASFDQIEYIKAMLEKIEEPEENYKFREMTIDEADKLIHELREKIELGG